MWFATANVTDLIFMKVHMDGLTRHYSLVSQTPNSPLVIDARTINHNTIVIETPDQNQLNNVSNFRTWERCVPSRTAMLLALCGNAIGGSLTRLDSAEVPLNRLIVCGTIILGALFTSVLLIKYSCDHLDSCNHRCREGSKLFGITTTFAVLTYCGFR